jgi:hypothetical protein
MAESAQAKTFSYNGAFHFTEKGSDRKTAAYKLGFMPRIGLAWRLDNWTVLRAGYGRFIVPASLANTERDDLGEIDLGGFTPTTVVPPVLAGIPQSYLSNPFRWAWIQSSERSSAGTPTSAARSPSTSTNSVPPSATASTSPSRDSCPGNSSPTSLLHNFVSHDQYSLNLEHDGSAAFVQVRQRPDADRQQSVLQLWNRGDIPRHIAAQRQDCQCRIAAWCPIRSMAPSPRPAPI